MNGAGPQRTSSRFVSFVLAVIKPLGSLPSDFEIGNPGNALDRYTPMAYIRLLFVFKKNERSDLTAKQIRILKDIAMKELQ